MRWLIAFLLMSSSALAETVTTTNVLPDISSFTTSGSTTSSSTSGCTAGEFCTGNATAGGGTYTSTFDVPLTEDEIRRGFTLNSAVTVDSHPSNATLSTCTSITQGSDCRDIFNVTVALFDVTNTVVEKFERQVELDFSGLRTFDFTDTVQENSFSILTGEFELFGVDAGFHSGFFGPKFSEPSLTFTHEQVVEQQILDQIVQNDVIAAAPPVQIDLPPPPINSPPPPAAAPIVVAVAPQAPSEPPPPPEIAPIQIDLPPPPMEQQQQEAQAEANIEAQIEQDIAPPPVEQPRSQEPESEPEREQPQQSSEREPEPEAQPTEAQPESQPSEPETESESSVEPPAETREAQAPPKPKSRQEKVKAAAEKAVAKIAPSQRYSAASQTTTMVAMSMISPKIAAPLALVDTPGFFTGAKVPDGPSMVDRMQNYTLFGTSNGSHNALVELDWKR